MAIAAFERAGRTPTTEEARAESPVHVRCGTDFIALFVICAASCSRSSRATPWWIAATVRIALLPVVAAVAYE